MITRFWQAPERRSRHVRFLEAGVQMERARRAVRVRLRRRGETVVGRSEDGESSMDQMRHAGEAAWTHSASC